MFASRRRVGARALAEWLLVALTCAVIAAGVTHFGWFWRIDQAIYDVSMSSLRGRVDRDVVIVGIDDRSLDELGHWPWPRGVHAELLRKLTAEGAGPVALDILFSEPARDDPQGDQALAEAIVAHGRVALPVTGGAGGLGATHERSHSSVFAKFAAAVGHAHVEFDPDGIVRSVFLWEGPARDPRPQLGLALLGLSDPEIAARYAPAQQGSAGWTRSGAFRIPFVGPPGAHFQVSYVDVLKGRTPQGLFAGKLVLVGAMAAGLGDMAPTPTSAFTRPMSGVEINANVYAALKNGLGVRAMPRGMAALAAALVVVGLMLLVIRLTPRQSLLTAFGVAFGLLAVAWALLHQFQLWIPPAGAVLGCMLAYPLWSWRRLEAAQGYLDEELDALHREASRWRPAPQVARASPTPDPVYGRLDLLRETASRQRQFRHFVIDTLEGLPTGVVVIDPSGSIQLHNRRAAALLGGEGVEAMLAALRRIEWPADLALLDGIPRSPRQPLSIEVQAPGGKNLHVTIAALNDRRSRTHGVVLSLSDITAVKQAQARREEAMQYLSHDLRAPLSSIVALVEGARHASEGADGRHRVALERVGKYADSALELTENLFRLVRAEGVDTRRFTVHDLIQIADDAAEEAWALARAKGIHLSRVEAGEDECLVLCEPSLLKRATLNLLTNAIKYSPAGSALRILIEREPAGWRLEVHDQGEGIEAEDLAQLFQRFGRLEQPDGRRVAGLGLGLMIVKTVVERHGGSVEVASHPGVGSVFSLHLPFARQ